MADLGQRGGPLRMRHQREQQHHGRAVGRVGPALRDHRLQRVHAPQQPAHLGGQLLLAFKQRPPDLGCGREVGQEVAERLDGEPAVIPDDA